MKKRILLQAFLAVTFLLISDIGYAPSSQAAEIQDKGKLTEQQTKHSGRIERRKKERDEYLERGERRIRSNAETSNVELVGMWPYGPCEAAALDSARNIALIGNGETFQVLDISTPDTPSKIGEVVLQAKPHDIAISGNYAYVVTRQSIRVIDISILTSPNEVGSAEFSGYGYAVEVSSNYAYVAAGREGLRIFDISAPANPNEVGFYSADNNSVYDVTTWGNYAFIINDYWTGTAMISQLRIIDVAFPSTPSLTGTSNGRVDWKFSGIASSGTGYAYISQFSIVNNMGELTIIDVVSDPTNPAEAGNYSESEKHFEDLVVSGNYAYLLVYLPSWGRTRLDIIDISAPSSLFSVGGCNTPSYKYFSLDISGNYVGISHQGDGLGLCDISNPSSPFYTGSYDTPDRIGYNGDRIAVSGDYAYMANCDDGLRIMDISSPANPIEAGVCDTVEGTNGVVISWNYAYGVDMGGFWIVDVSSSSSPSQTGYLDILWNTRNVAVSGNYAYVAGYQYVSGESRACLGVIDITDPLTPSLVGTYVCSTRSMNYGGIALSGNYAYLGLHDYSTGSMRAGLRIIDITDPANPTEIGSFVSSSIGSTSDIKVRGNYAYLAGDKFRIIDVSIPANPTEISSYQSPCQGLSLSGNYAYLSSSYTLTLIDISDLYNLTEAGYYRNDLSTAVAVSGNYAYVPGSLYILKNTLAPEVFITSPSAWSEVGGSVSIEALASHSSGIALVEFYINDILRSTDSASPYSYLWDTSSETEGLYKIRVRAYNNDGKYSDCEIRVNVRASWNLTISCPSAGTTDPVPGTYSYSPGTDVIVEAFPDSGYNFSGWTGDVPSGQEMDNPVTITMDADKSITANFSIIPGNFELTINSALGGTTSPAPGVYSHPPGAGVLITAIPGPGGSFLYWTGDVPSGHENDNPLSITMDSAKSITPHFSFAPKMWTFIVYLDGDNDLEGEAIDNFVEMAAVGSDANINIVVQFDRISGYDTRYGNWTSTKRFYVTNGMTPVAENALEDLGELNHGDPQTLADFASWAKATWPANNYALVLWNHGGGWRLSKDKLQKQRLERKKEITLKNVCWDETDGNDSLYSDEVQSALNSSGGAELIAFAACYMGMVEVAYEVRNYGEVMVGSEEFSICWNYDTILQDLKNNPTWSAAELAAAIVDHYTPDLTISAIDLSNMDTLASTISSFAQTMIDNWDTDPNAVRNASQAVMTEIENTVIHEKHGSYCPMANGLAIYFPGTYDGWGGIYTAANIDFAADTQWDEFLQEFIFFMEGSWIELRSEGSQHFEARPHIDLYHFCELLNTEPENYYSESQIPHEYIGGGTAQNFHYNEEILIYSLPFDFPYFGEIIPAGTAMYICSNGFVDFAASSTDHFNYSFKLTNNKRIAPLWKDLVTNGSAQAGEDIYITENSDNLIIRWVAETDSYGEPVNMELILYDDGRIQFNYGGGNSDLSPSWFPPTIGISKGDGYKFNISAYNRQTTLTDVDSYLFTPVAVDNPPSVSITSPSDGDSVSGTVDIQASASDDNAVTKVEFYIDDVLKSTDTSFPYVYSWNTTTYSNGAHTVKAIAYDTIDQTAYHEISVTVANYITYTLTISASAGGTTNPAPGIHTYNEGTVVNITASPDTNYMFSAWTGDVPSGHENDNPLSITMDSNKSITPHYAIARDLLPIFHGHDFNGDGISDVAVFRPSNGTWYLRNIGTYQWGTSGDIPANGDYNGDGTTDIAVYRPSDGRWYIKDQAGHQWGTAGDIPVPGDYNGDGTTDIAVWRPSDGIWYIKDIAYPQWGASGDIPVPVDYDRDGTADIAVFRPSDGRWYIKDQATHQWGTAGDVPVPGDYDGDGTPDIAVFRSSDGRWYIKDIATHQWGTSGDITLVR